LNHKENRTGSWFLVPLVLVLFIAGLWFLVLRYEGGKPEFHFTAFPEKFGATTGLSVEVSDSKSGLRRIWVGLITNGKEKVLIEKNYESRWLLSGSSVKMEQFGVNIDPKKLDIPDGPAVLQLKAWDYSWRRWWHGNQTILEKNIIIDTRPPAIEIITQTHNVRQGGCGLVIYRLSEACPEHGVMVGDNFFPGHGGYFQDAQVYLSFFALNHLQGRGTLMKVRAVDGAGNTASSGFPNYIRNKVFKEDKIDLSDDFLNTKIPELAAGAVADGASSLEKFLFVNRNLREKNELQAKGVGAKTESTLLWRGAFGCLPRAETRATFADLRHYYYNGKAVDQQRHLGIDLASNAHSEVPAANNGKIAFCGIIGIYGNTVIIDHGFGLFSIYAHLSNISVAEGDWVATGQGIGNTGTTGLAGGDHLHFGMLLHNTLVDPIEWWDKEWIRNNITGKLDSAAERFVRTE
jgi:murein DD-endopeptidase MepM/ murein hydrolase activator NlpD